MQEERYQRQQKIQNLHLEAAMPGGQLTEEQEKRLEYLNQLNQQDQIQYTYLIYTLLLINT